MKNKALLLSFAAHMVVLFGIVVAVTFARKDFDFKLTALISAGYITALSIYFIIIIIALETGKNGDRRKRN